MRRPILTCGIFPVARHEKSVRRETGSRASNCFWSMKRASSADVWLFSARMPISVLPALAGDLVFKNLFHCSYCPISYSSQLRILPGAGRAHCVIFTQNDVRDFGRNRREFYTGSHGRFGRQNEFSSRQQRVAIMFTMLLPLQPQSAPCFCRFPFNGSASANYRTSTAME
jgi:hypothetical protein